jgi:hypothetical protein
VGWSGLLRFDEIIANQEKRSTAENHCGDSSQTFRPFTPFRRHILKDL